ncbi:hypothetical protein DL93DRAFT_2167155 [Clavulina sp. PMI_390]|nr:hypothetical protein DL93DRAFT_2167155 [Clavulina sp. PMI_390]
MPELLEPPRSQSRPGSSLSTRPPSRASVLQGGRVPKRARLSTRNNHLIHTLIEQTLHTAEDDPAINSQVDAIARTLDSGKHSAPLSTMRNIDDRLKGLAEKHEVMLDEALANSLTEAWMGLKQHVEDTAEHDSQVRTRNLPEMMQFLDNTREFAVDYLDRSKNPQRESDALTWAAILRDEPLEGEHWKGAYGLPPGATKEGWEAENFFESDSDASDLSDFDLRHLNIQGTRKNTVITPVLSETESLTSAEDEMHVSGQDVMSTIVSEEMEALQYWKQAGLLPREFDGSTPGFDLGDPSTLAATIATIKKATISARPGVILESDAVREVLFMLQGHGSILAVNTESTKSRMATLQIKSEIPTIAHFSAASLRSILEFFATQATIMFQLREFTRSVYEAACTFPSSSTHKTPAGSRTFEAFAAAVDAEIRAFDSWCAAKEESIVQAQSGKVTGTPPVCTLLSLSHKVSATMSSSFEMLLAVVESLQQLRPKQTVHDPKGPYDFSFLPPALLSTIILDRVTTSIRTERMKGQTASANVLTAVIVKTMEPLWASVGVWMRQGMEFQDTAGTGADSEFFIERHSYIRPGSTEFWLEGHTLRTYDVDTALLVERARVGHSTLARPHNDDMVPLILGDLASDILSAGKAVGLLRALQIDDFFSNGEGEARYQWMDTWPSFAILVDSADTLMSAHSDGRGSPLSLRDVDSRRGEMDVAFTSEDIASLIRERLDPWCRVAHARLNRVITYDCELWRHVDAIEGLYFMQHGDFMSRFCAAFFERIEAGKPWNDYHSLNSTFRDVVSREGLEDLFDHRLVRLNFRGLRERHPTATVKAFEGLILEYQVPFPLTYLFNSDALRAYASIFVVFMQLRFARWILDKMMITLRANATKDLMSSPLMKQLTALRSRLIWFLSTIMRHLSSNVLDLHRTKFHDALAEARSLDEMIMVHDRSLEALEFMCLVRSETSSARKGVISILDLGLQLNAAILSAVEQGPTSAASQVHSDPLRRMGPPTRRRRRLNKVQRSRLRNVINFSADAHLPADVDEQDEDEATREEEEILREHTVDDVKFVPGGTTSIVGDQTSAMDSQMSFAPDGSLEEAVARISAELDVLVRHVKKQVESFSAGGLGTASFTPLGIESGAFSMLSFAFEDWDL